MECNHIFNRRLVITPEGGKVHLGKPKEGPIVKM